MPDYFKWVGAVGVLAGVAWTVHQWDESRHAPKVHLVATASYGAVVRTPEIDDLKFRALNVVSTDSWLERAAVAAVTKLKPGPNSREVVYQALYEYKLAVAAALRDELKFQPQPAGFIHFRVRNDGSLTANKVELEIPYAIEVILNADPTGQTHEGESRQLIGGHHFQLGDLPPQGEVNLIAYTAYRTVSTFDLNDAKLVYKDGIGEIRDGMEHSRDQH